MMITFMSCIFFILALFDIREVVLSPEVPKATVENVFDYDATGTDEIWESQLIY